jgi:acyl carrier protein
MTEHEVFEKIVPLIREVTGARENQIRMDSGLMQDLGAESIDLLDLSFLIEETFGINIEADEFEKQASERIPTNSRSKPASESQAVFMKRMVT